MRSCSRLSFFSCWIAVVTFWIHVPSASAQLIGNRTVGGPALSLQQQRTGAANLPTPPSNGVGATVGTQGSNARYRRGNRSKEDFVGSNRSEQSGFVGAGQAIGVGRVPSATDNLRIETTRSDRINRPLPLQPAKGMYYPRLSIDAEQEVVPDDKTSGELPAFRPAHKELLERVTELTEGNATVMMSGTTAVLQGTVHSARAAELLAQILSFEPGIDRVKNELIVK